MSNGGIPADIAALLILIVLCATALGAYAEYLRRDRDRLRKELEERKRRAEKA